MVPPPYVSVPLRSGVMYCNDTVVGSVGVPARLVNVAVLRTSVPIVYVFIVASRSLARLQCGRAAVCCLCTGGAVCRPCCRGAVCCLRCGACVCGECSRAVVRRQCARDAALLWRDRADQLQCECAHTSE